MNLLGNKRKRTNTFTIRASDGAIGGRLKRNGDLDLSIDGHLFATIPGNLIPALAHWLSSVNGRFADVLDSKLQANAAIIPLSSGKSRTE